MFFWLLCISIASFLCFSVYYFSLVFFRDCLFSFLFFCISCLCSKFMFCDYHNVCIKHLTDETVLLLLTATCLHLPIWVSSFSFSPLAFLLSQITPFYVVSLLPNLSSYSYFFCLFSFSFYALIKCLQNLFWGRVAIFWFIYHLTQSLGTFAFSSLIGKFLSIFLTNLVLMNSQFLFISESPYFSFTSKGKLLK